MNIPLLSAALAKFDVVVESITCDSAASNLKYINSRADTDKVSQALVLHTPCHVHISNNIQKLTFTSVGPTISAMISLTLALQPSGALTTLQHVICRILFDNVEVVVAPQPLDCWATRHRAAVMDLCLPRDSAGAKRRAVLT
jgi:hypothetical protein